MEIQVIILFALTIIILGVALVWYAVIHNRISEKLAKSEKQNLFLRYHLQEKSLQKINATKDRSAEIIQTAIQQAEEILKQADNLKIESNDQARKELETLTQQQKETLEKAAQEMLEQFSDTIKHLEEKDIDIFGNITKDIESVAAKEVQQFEKQLQASTIGKQQVIDQKIQEAYNQTRQEIEAYKKAKMARIDEEIYVILRQAVKEIIGKRLTFEDHKELVMKALEKAKGEMVS